MPSGNRKASKAISSFFIFTPLLKNLFDPFMDKPTSLHFPLPDLDLVLVEGGTFDMGDETGDLWDACRPVHPVKVSSFYICKFQVTQRLYEQVTKANPSHFKGEKRPVEAVSWNDAQKFIEQLNGMDEVQEFLKKQGLPGAEFRLPTEAEWEFAARGGIYSQGYDYCGSDKLKQVGWYNENSNRETHDVGLLLANELGLYDMSGNVNEWCGDWFDKKYYSKCICEDIVSNPKGHDKSGYRVQRGGYCSTNVGNCRSTNRLASSPNQHDFSIGFRLCLSLQSAG